MSQQLYSMAEHLRQKLWCQKMMGVGVAALHQKLCCQQMVGVDVAGVERGPDQDAAGPPSPRLFLPSEGARPGHHWHCYSQGV